MKNTCTVRAVNPRDLTQGDFEKLNEVTQDMWAHGIGELVQCKCCNKMMSKQDIFGHLEKEVYDETVKKIMGILSMSEIACISCGGDTKFIYGEDHVENIKERLLQSEESFLVVCENETGELVGYEEGYVDSLENIFKRELAYHYEVIGVDEIKKRIENIIGYNPEKLLVLSSIGILNKYSNFFTIFEILKHFAINMPDKYKGMYGISELDINNNLDFLSKHLGTISLGIYEDPELREKIVNTGDGYKSNLVLFPDVVDKYKYYLSNGVKAFMKLTRK
ncbi:MAG: hypothetical protein AB7E37_00495 [Candidatus Altimarinota bacterium]